MCDAQTGLGSGRRSGGIKQRMLHIFGLGQFLSRLLNHHCGITSPTRCVVLWLSGVWPNGLLYTSGGLECLPLCKWSVRGFEQLNVLPAEELLQLKGVSLWGHVLQCGKRPLLFALFGCQKSLIVENSVVQICSLL